MSILGFSITMVGAQTSEHPCSSGEQFCEKNPSMTERVEKSPTMFGSIPPNLIQNFLIAVTCAGRRLDLIKFFSFFYIQKEETRKLSKSHSQYYNLDHTHSFARVNTLWPPTLKFLIVRGLRPAILIQVGSQEFIVSKGTKAATYRNSQHKRDDGLDTA